MGGARLTTLRLVLLERGSPGAKRLRIPAEPRELKAADGKKGNALHEYEFKNKEDLRRFFTPHFKFVKVWETIYPTRHNLYFAASQSEISPFD